MGIGQIGRLRFQGGAIFGNDLQANTRQNSCLSANRASGGLGPLSMFLAIELCLTVVCAALAYIRPKTGDGWLTPIERRFTAFANRQALAVITIGLLALGIRAALLPILPVPQPEVHDEYSYLLLGDTFSHGRLANPTHPMWEHFETFHVNWHPTYSSMYYPAQGLFLAFGQRVMGHPFWGVWLSSGLMCAAICWALQGWMPPPWALLGAVLAVIRLATFSYWSDSYWGGSVTAIGGALVLGAFPRIKQDRRVRDAVLMALGMALLASTRPFEGLFFSIPLLVALAWWGLRSESPSATDGSSSRKRFLTRTALPAGLVMLLAFAALGYYFWRVTGSPFTTPYQLNMRTYGLVYFPWQKIGIVPEFHHPFMRMLYRGGAVVGMYNFARQHPIELQLGKALVIWLFYFGPILSLPWLVWLFTRPQGQLKKTISPNLRFLLVTCLVTCGASALTIYVGQPHYAAPLTATFYAATLLVMRDLYNWQSEGERSGLFLVRAVPLVCGVLLLLRIAAPAIHIEPKPSWTRTWCSQDAQNLARARILSQLEQTPGDHLVIVRYRPEHDFILDEWVFNNADIDGSKVLWARDMGAQNAELVEYFRGRTVWLIEPDNHPARLTPYAE